MEALWDRKLVLVTGKGGVGKTTITAALVRAAAAAGRRVLAAEVSNDASTGSPLMQRLGRPDIKGLEPVSLDSGIDGVRLVPSTGHRQFLQAALRVRVLVDAAMRSAALKRFLMAAPAFPEVGTLFQLVELLRREVYDHVIIDLPATGHALGLASLPRTVLKVVPGGLIGNAIKEGLDTMTDPQRAHAVLASLPEAMPVSETVELHRGLEKLGIRVGGLVLNRIPEDPFSDAERDALDHHLRHRDRRLMGSREFRRLDRARTAKARFHEEAPEGTPRWHIDEVHGDDQAVLAGVLDQLEARQ